MNFVGRARFRTRFDAATWARFSACTRSASILLLSLMLAGCCARGSLQPANSRPFEFETDTFAYANELVWEYYYDEEGKWRHRRREPAQDYTHHCFVVARSARQFFQHATFDPDQPIADKDVYRKRIREVMGRDPAEEVDRRDRVIIPGYANLREFSEAQEALLQEECGGAWQSYFQRGNWRMVLPFSRAGQEQIAHRLAASICNNRPPVVHLVRFPRITINHTVLLYDWEEAPGELRFQAYDPNQPEAPTALTFHENTRTFMFPTNDYFKGGRVDVYEIYRSWNY